MLGQSERAGRFAGFSSKRMIWFSMLLSGGGTRLVIDGTVVRDAPEAEYAMLYARFAEVVRTGVSDVDLAPLQLVADAFMLGGRVTVEAFAASSR